jgi:hypothetical protein
MATLASLNVFLGLNSAKFRDGLKRSTKNVADFSKFSVKSITAVTKTFAKITASVTAASAATAYAAAKTIDSIDQVRQEAGNVGILTSQWQSYVFAAQQANVESDGLKDVIKDLNAKITDAAVNGGGAMVDFFRRTNQSARDWQELAPDKQFESFVNEINKLPESEARFFLDEVNDTAAELYDTLVANKGEFFANAKRAKELGIVLSDDVVAEVKKAQGEINALTAVTGSLWKNTVAAATPAISEIAKGIQGWITKKAEAEGGFHQLGKTIALSVVNGVRWATQSLETLFSYAERGILKIQSYSNSGIFAGMNQQQKEFFFTAFENYQTLNKSYQEQEQQLSKIKENTKEYNDVLGTLGRTGDSIFLLEQYFSQVGYSTSNVFTVINTGLDLAEQKIQSFGVTAEEVITKVNEDTTASAFQLSNALTTNLDKMDGGYRKTLENMTTMIGDFQNWHKMSESQKADAVVGTGEYVLGQFAGQSKTAAAMQKGLMIYQATMTTYDMAVKAYDSLVGIPYIGPFIAPGAAALAVAFGMSRVNQIKSMQVSGQRYYGGNVQPNSLYEVNEYNKPELFEQGGKQFLMTGKQGGKVVSHDDGFDNSSGSSSVTMNNHYHGNIRDARKVRDRNRTQDFSNARRLQRFSNRPA